MRTVIKFVAVGLTCFVVQYLILHTLELALPSYAANWIGFIVSAQLNFALSYTFTFNHTARKTGAALVRTWLKFMGAVVFSSFVNTAAFSIASFLWKWPDLLAVALSVLVSTGTTLFLQYYIVFKPQPHSLEEMIKQDTYPASLILTPESEHEEIDAIPGIVLFMPAYNEARNLELIIDEAVIGLEKLNERFMIIIVDDGSTDDTRDVVEKSMLTYPGHVHLVTHHPNQGYGAALRTGLKAGLEMGYEWVGFCDSDRQFKPKHIGRLIARAVRHEADIAIGYRINRADGFKRRLMGRVWHHLSHAVLGFSARDVDCGFKVFRRSALVDIVPLLRGNHATISPEILARAHLAGHHIIEVPVPHYAREFGAQTGANYRVIVESLKGLLSIRHAIRHDLRLKTTRSAGVA